MLHTESRIRRLFGLQSLRRRYLYVALLLSLGLLAGTWSTQYYVTTTSRTSATNIEARNRVVQYTRLIRNAVWGAEYALESYVLAPSPAHRAAVEDKLATARAETTRLLAVPWIAANRQRSEVASLQSNLGRLDSQAKHLMDIRANASLLFPSMEIMDRLMSPNNREFVSLASLALDEVGSDIHGGRIPDSYRLFEGVRHAWTQMVSAFRIYVVMRAGIFGNTPAGLQEESNNVDLLYQEVQYCLRGLEAVRRRGGLGLQGTASLQRMEVLARAWHTGFAKVRALQESGHWRTDVPLMEQTIQPLFASIWNGLAGLDKRIEQSAERDVGVWSAVARRIIATLWVLTVAGLALVVAGFAYFERTVLEPIAQVARALKALARGEPQAELPRAGSREALDLITAFQDMDSRVQERQLALEHQALHDSLTGLPNRVLLRDRLQQAVFTARRENECFALLMLDLDRFKEINDTLGHHAGDRVLRQVSARLTEILRRSDTVARLGGDEFAVLLPDTDQAGAEAMAAKIGALIEQPIEVDDRRLFVGASTGIALFPEHGDDPHALLQRADVAMYVAKQGNLSHAVYDPRQDQHSLTRLTLISELRDAIRRDELALHYQPKITVGSGEVVGVEGLLRWRRPRWSKVPTEELVRIAEETGLIKPLTLWVLNSALRQCAEWRRGGLHLPIAINLSAWNLQNSELDHHARALLAHWEVPAGCLELEITESAMMHYPERAMEILHQLDRLGVRLTVDDYGTGFSSLAYLKQMPIRELKIDKSFVMDMTVDENDAVIVRSTIDMAHNLGLRVVAEGVADQEILDLLEILGCDTAQGHHICPPLPAPELERWIRDHGHQRNAQLRLA